MVGGRSTLLLLLPWALAACSDGFKSVTVDGGGPDAADAGPTDGSAVDRPAPTPDGQPPTPDGGCAVLGRSLGPVSLGYAGAYSQHNSLAASPAGVAAVWETVDATDTSLSFGVLDADGRIVVKAIELDATDWAPSAAIATLGSGSTFGLLHVRDAASPKLLYRRLDDAGSTEKMAQLAEHPGGYISGPALAPAGGKIAVGYARHGADKAGTALLGAIDESGAIVTPFASPASSPESRDVALLATGQGFVAAWAESRPEECWAVVASRLDASMAPLAGWPKIVADGAGNCYRRPSLAAIGDELLICYDRTPSDGDGDGVIVCRTLGLDGTLGKESVSEAPVLSSLRPRAVAAGDRFAVLWTAKALGVEEVYGRVLSRAGEPLGVARKLSEDGVRSFYPAAVWTGDGLLATWYRYVPITVYYAAFRLGCESP